MKIFDRLLWQRALHDPVIALGMAVDLAPIIGVLVFGWGASALVFLYWLENLLIGAMTLGRIVLASIVNRAVGGVFFGVFLCCFFTVHYGMFCMGHGAFLMGFSAEFSGTDPGFGPAAIAGMAIDILEQWPTLKISLYLLAAWQVYVFFAEDIPFAQDNPDEVSPIKEMFVPYGRIVLLHIGVFAGAASVIALGDPMIGVFGLIMLRASFGFVVNSVRRFQRRSTVNTTQS